MGDVDGEGAVESGRGEEAERKRKLEGEGGGRGRERRVREGRERENERVGEVRGRLEKVDGSRMHLQPCAPNSKKCGSRVFLTATTLPCLDQSEAW